MIEADAFDDVHATLGVEIAEVIRGLRTGHALQNARRHFNEGDLAALFCGNGGGFEADIPAPNDQELAARRELWRHGVRVLEVTNRVNTVQISTNRRRQRARV